MTTSISSGEYKRWEGEEGRKEGRRVEEICLRKKSSGEEDQVFT